MSKSLPKVFAAILMLAPGVNEYQTVLPILAAGRGLARFGRCVQSC